MEKRNHPIVNQFFGTLNAQSNEDNQIDEYEFNNIDNDVSNNTYEINEQQSQLLEQIINSGRLDDFSNAMETLNNLISPIRNDIGITGIEQLDQFMELFFQLYNNQYQDLSQLINEVSNNI